MCTYHLNSCFSPRMGCLDHSRLSPNISVEGFSNDLKSAFWKPTLLKVVKFQLDRYVGYECKIAFVLDVNQMLMFIGFWPCSYRGPEEPPNQLYENIDVLKTGASACPPPRWRWSHHCLFVLFVLLHASVTVKCLDGVTKHVFHDCVLFLFQIEVVHANGQHA